MNLFNKVFVSASTHPAGKGYLNYAKKIASLGVDFLHCDIMDGKFVKDKTITYKNVEAINSCCTIPLDVHLMVENPTQLISDYLDAGANILTVHYESYKSRKTLKSDLKKIQEAKVLAGLSFKPSTDINYILQYLEFVNVVLVMGVEPGKSGQPFIESTFDVIKKLSDYREMHKLNFLIEVDGGINGENCEKAISAGADMLVSGTYLYCSENKEETIKKLKGL